MVKSIAFVGLGAMGARMAVRATSQLGLNEVVGYDVDHRRMADLQARAGVTPTVSPADAAAACDMVLTCLPDDSVVRKGYFGERGIASGVRAGSVTIDCSTIGPGTSREVAASLRDIGVSHLDAGRKIGIGFRPALQCHAHMR